MGEFGETGNLGKTQGNSVDFGATLGFRESGGLGRFWGDMGSQKAFAQIANLDSVSISGFGLFGPCGRDRESVFSRFLGDGARRRPQRARGSKKKKHSRAKKKHSPTHEIFILA